MKRWTAGMAFAAIGTIAAPALAQEPLAVLTELQIGRGQVHVRVDGGDWTAPQPLQALRLNDQVRVIGEGRAVLIVAGAPEPVFVTRNNSPYTVQPPSDDGVADRVRALLGGLTNFLVGQARERSYPALSVRALRPETVIIAPRQTRIVPGAVTFEWSGADTGPYRVRLLDEHGVVWEQADVARRPLGYPATAPALQPGGRYAWEVRGPDRMRRRAAFEVMSAADARRVREALALLAAPDLSTYPPDTRTVLHAALLLQEGLNADARRELLTAIGSSPGEPSLHLLLAETYDRTGLPNLAADEYDEARRLARSQPAPGRRVPR